LQSQVEKENRCEQSISQRGSSGYVDCTEIMYSIVQNGKLARGERERRGRGDEGERASSPSPFLASPSANPSPSPADGVTMVCKGD